MGDEAKEVYMTSKIVLNFQSVTSHNILLEPLLEWRNSTPTSDMAMIRTLHVNFSFRICDDPGINHSQPLRYERCPDDQYSNADKPLFRVEIRKDGKELRVLAIHPLIEILHTRLAERLRPLELRQKAKFDGLDIFAVVEELIAPPVLWMSHTSGGIMYLIQMWVIKQLDGRREEQFLNHGNDSKLASSTSDSGQGEYESVIATLFRTEYRVDNQA